MPPQTSAAAPAPDFRSLFESAPGLYLVLTPDFQIAAASDAYLHATMTRRQEILGRNLFEVFPDNPADAEATGMRNLRASLERVLASGAPDAMAVQKYDVRRRPEHGGGFVKRYWSPVNSPVIGPDGAITYIIHRVEDVTDFLRLKEREHERSQRAEAMQSRMEAEIFERAQQLQEANVKLRAATEDSARRDAERERIIEGTGDAMVVVDREGTVRFANTAAERLFGRSRAEIIGTSFGFPVGAGESTEVDLSGGRVAEMRVVDLLWGGEDACLASLRDITERKEAEDAARRLWRMRAAREEGEKERGRLQELLERAPAAVLRTRGADHVCVFANPRARQLVGDRTLVGQALADVLAELRGQGFLEGFERAFSTGMGGAGDELELSAGGGPEGTEEKRYLEVTWEPIHDDGHVDGVMCFAHDVTAQVATRRALEQTMERLREEERRKDQFLAVLGHELRNPLAGIDGGLRLLESGADPDRGQWAIEMMRKQVRQLTGLLDDLLDVASIARGKLELRRRVVGMRDMVDAATASAASRLAAAEQELSVVLPEEPLWVDGDPQRVEQLLTNLLVNASKYSPARTLIRLTARSEGGHAVIEVQDHGSGIVPEMLERIFEPFIQAPRGDGLSVPGGLGIGLTLVRQLAVLHGGSASARSDGPGLGSTFTIRLPLAAAAPVQSGRGQESSVDLGERRVLVVDDNRDAALALAELLNMIGCQAQAVTSGGEALALASAEAFDAVLLDLDLPDLSGYEVAARLRRCPPTRELLIVAVSGFGDETSRERSRQSGIEHHLVKPVELNELIRLLGKGSPAQPH